jgi:GNAT superfamily N-acetyltransferase
MKAEVSSAIAIRGLTRDDRAFVLDSFRRHIVGDPAVHDMLEAGVTIHVRELDRLLRGGSCGRFAVASLAASPECIEGWAVSSEGRLVFAYVRPHFRRWGIAGALVDALVPEVTPLPVVYWTRDAELIHRERGYPMVWDWQTFQSINRHHRMKGAA